MKPNTLADFWQKVKKSDDCWTWTRGKDDDGYGVFWWKNRQWRCHRFVAKIVLGWEIGGLEVCHTCDNPSCVKPSHLFVGTTADNAADREAKGRGMRGRTQAPTHIANRVAARLKNGKKWTPEMKERMSRIKRGLS